jgi:hypothetical protein
MSLEIDATIINLLDEVQACGTSVQDSRNVYQKYTRHWAVMRCLLFDTQGYRCELDLGYPLLIQSTQISSNHHRHLHRPVWTLHEVAWCRQTTDKSKARMLVSRRTGVPVPTHLLLCQGFNHLSLIYTRLIDIEYVPRMTDLDVSFCNIHTPTCPLSFCICRQPADLPHSSCHPLSDGAASAQCCPFMYTRPISASERELFRFFGDALCCCSTDFACNHSKTSDACPDQTSFGRR